MSLSPYEQMLVQKVLGEAHIQNVHKVLSPSTFQTIIDNVQGRYRYCVSPNGNIVKFVIAEFLAVEVNIEI